MAVNVENVRKVIEKLRDEENYFSMSDFFVDGVAIHDSYSEEEMEKIWGAVPPMCNTAACIGGWAEHIMREETGHKRDYTSYELGERA